MNCGRLSSVHFQRRPQPLVHQGVNVSHLSGVCVSVCAGVCVVLAVTEVGRRHVDKAQHI